MYFSINYLINSRKWMMLYCNFSVNLIEATYFNVRNFYRTRVRRILSSDIKYEWYVRCWVRHDVASLFSRCRHARVAMAYATTATWRQRRDSVEAAWRQRFDSSTTKTILSLLATRHSNIQDTHETVSINQPTAVALWTCSKDRCTAQRSLWRSNAYLILCRLMW